MLPVMNCAKSKYLSISFFVAVLFMQGILGTAIVPSCVLALQTKRGSHPGATGTQQPNTDHEIVRAANQILRGSIELYNEKAYWKSARELIILMDYYPEFDRLDEVIYYLAQCLFEEDLSISATRMFKHLIKKYPKSPLVPAALLGLEKTYYNQKDYKMALSIYFALLKQPAPDREILNEACYYAGLSHYNLQNYDMAINVLKKIDDRSNFYDSALYTTALAYLKKSTVATAVDFFRKIVALPIISGERRDVVDNARLTLGLIYYELKSYDAAIKLLEEISEKHQNYPDALLALGWCYLKLEDHQNVIKYLKKLIKLYPDSENAEEAYFLLGQSHIALGDYDSAIQSYQTIVDIYQDKVQLPNLISKVNTSLEQEQDRVEKLKVRVLVEESKLLDAISLDGYGKELPKHIVSEKKKLKEYREKLISSLITERDNLLYLQESIYNLKKLAERRERRKDWKGYAEYGISRALFLKNMKTARGN